MNFKIVDMIRGVSVTGDSLARIDTGEAFIVRYNMILHK